MIAIYTRQSLDKKDSISIQTQEEFCRREAGISEETHVYTDRGFSGKNTDRPAFQTMMADLDRLPITKVVVYRLDRISRSLLDFADFIQTLEQRRISFVSATEKIDTATPMGRAMLYIVAVFAQLERETIAQRVRDNYYARLREGSVGGGPAPFGFRLQKIRRTGRLQTIYAPTKALSLVGQMFSYYLLPGQTLSSLLHQMQTEHPSLFSSWTTARLSCLLRSPVYVRADEDVRLYYLAQGTAVLSETSAFDGIHGCLLAGKDGPHPALAIGAHEGIVDSGLFLACQQKLHQKRPLKNSGKGKYSFLTGQIHCAGCGHAFSVRLSACAQGKVAYFVCSGRYLHHTCALRQTHRVADVEQAIGEAINKRLASFSLPDTVSPQTLSAIESRRALLLQRLEEDASLPSAYIAHRLADLDQEEAALTQGAAPMALPDFFSLSFEQKKAVAACLIQNVILGPGQIRLCWK